MDIEEIKQFLVEAESKTYVAGKEGDVFKTELSLSLPREIVYEYPKVGFSKPDLRYIDRYFGGLKFAGQEVIFKNYDVPVWGRSYYGVISPTSDYTKEMILSLVKQGRSRFISNLWGGAAEWQSLVGNNFIFVIRFPNPNNASLGNFIYHEWIFPLCEYQDMDDECEEKVLFHRVCTGGIIE